MIYTINTFSQAEFSFRLYHNTGKKTWQEIQQETGCYGLINTAYFVLSTYQVDSQTMIAGKWVKEGPWNDYGICVDKDGYLTVDTTQNAVYDYAIGLPSCYIKGEKYPTYKDKAKNGVSFVGTTADNSVVCLISSKDDGMTAAEACEIMLNAGCVNILQYDGSWSSQGSLGPGKDVDPSEERKAAVYLLIFKKDTLEEETDMSKKVVLDPGHGVETAGKRSPDGSYREYEFTLDMAKRIKSILERHGVSVKLTRETESDVPLASRVGISNDYSPDLFVSLHSNAAGSGATWMSVRGYGVYTSSPGDNAGRNVAAKKLIAQAKQAGVGLWGAGLHHDRTLYVLKNTVAPAVLIEHLFHDNREDVALLKSDTYRDLLATVDAKGILDYLGITWKEPAADTLYRVQLGAFSKKENAERLAAELKAKGYQTYIVKA